jgi:hypothetical protein
MMEAVSSYTHLENLISQLRAITLFVMESGGKIKHFDAVP